MNQIYIHVGLHRTGTTFLQKYVFPKIRGIKYYDRYNRYRIRNFLLSIEDNENKPVLISDEGLSNYNYTDHEECSAYKIADRLHTLFPSAKIIVVFRKKEEWIKSLYNYYVKIGGDKDFESWRDEIFAKKDIDFKEYENYLRDLFDDVLVLWYEKLNRNPRLFVQDICNFMSVPMPDFEIVKENPSFNERANKLLLAINRRHWIPDVLRGLTVKTLKYINR